MILAVKQKWIEESISTFDAMYHINPDLLESVYTNHNRIIQAIESNDPDEANRIILSIERPQHNKKY